MKDSFSELLNKDMDRKEFLAHIGATAMVVTGVTGLLRAITSPHTQYRGSGYGGQSYGGSSVGAATRPTRHV